MKHILSILIVLIIFNNAFSQTVNQDTLRAREYLRTSEKFKEESKFENSLEYLKKAEKIYSTYNLNKALLECELKKSDIFIRKGDLNQALEILKTGKQKALSLSGENSVLYADFCEKTGLVYLYVKKYSDAKKLWIKTLVIRKKIYDSNHIKLSDSYNNLGVLYSQTGDYLRSLKLHQNALKIREEILPEDDLKIAASLMNIGRAYSKIENPDLTLIYFLKSLKIKKKKLDSFNPELASLYNITGDVYKKLEEYNLSIKNYKNALLIKQNNNGENHPETAGIYANLGDVYNLTGNYNKASEYNEKALRIFKGKYGENHWTVAKILINIGSVYLNKDDIKKAIENFNNSLEISKKLYKVWNLKTAQQYTKIGLILNKKNENIAAENYFNNALKIQQNVLKSDNHPEIAETYLNIGNTYKNNKEYYAALENYNKSLAIRLKISGNKHPETARIYKLTASVYKAKKEYTAELKYLQKALISNIENFDSQDITTNSAFNKSNFCFNQNIVLETLNMKAGAFWNLYLRTNNTDNLKEAFKVYKLSDLIIERIKKTVLKKEDKKYLAENISKVYEKAAVLCLQLYKKTNENKYLNKSFYYSEKNKQGVLLSIPEATDFADVLNSVLNVETDLLADITYFRKKVTENPGDTKIRTKLLTLYKEHNSFISNLKNNHKEYYELKYKPVFVTAEDIQNLINDSTLVLHYFYPETSKYMYVYMIEKDKTSIRFIKNIDAFSDKIISFRKHLISDDESSVKAYAREGYSLYKDLLPNISENDGSTKQLIIIPDGNLGMIPFESLLTEEYFGSWNQFSDYPYLIKKYAVSYSLSANELQKNLYENYQRKINLSINDSVDSVDSIYMDDWVGIAPVFDDMSINKTSGKTRDILKNTQKTFQDNTQTHFLSNNNISYLPESENEITAIYNAFQNSEKMPETDLREEADEFFIKSIDSEEFKIIHIASHGFINSEKPEFSGIILANSNTDENDGILLMNEIFDMKLNSDLIVLSAFETGIKKFRRGEGILALTRALLYTGTKNIVISLWQVSDKSTVKLMVNFYKDILNKHDNPPGYNHSLQTAKLKLINEGEYAHPFYWSPFILIGN
ncbi:MAG: tetratricopeptide repeat protein [Bacteroidales bacterium]|nr:tetratricopeptide repeat protein [Bacteroidales bacterium]